MPRNATTKTAAKKAPAKAAVKAPARKTAAKKAAATRAKQDVLALLKEDHQKVRKMFDQFEKMKEKDGNEAEIQQLVRTVCTELTIHAQLEEELFYPAMREAAQDAEDLLDEAQVEHDSAKQLITELSSMRPGDPLYEAKVTVLGEYVKHHVEEEEKEMFQKAKKAKLDLASLAQQTMQRKQELRQELGLDMDMQEDEEMAVKSTARRRSLH